MKRGTPADRLACAAFARAQRARFPTLHGGWTYHEWCCHQVACATSNKLSVLTRERRNIAADLAYAASGTAIEATKQARALEAQIQREVLNDYRSQQ